MGRDVKMDVQLDASQVGYIGRLDVVAGPTGRRTRTDAEKGRIAAESLSPGAVVADIARRHGVTRWQIYDWRRHFRSGRAQFPSEDFTPTPAFVPLAVEGGGPTDSNADMIEVAIGDVVIRIGPDVNETLLARIFRAVRAAS